MKLFVGIGIFVFVCGAVGTISGRQTTTHSGASATASDTISVHQIGETLHVGYWTYRVNGFRWASYVGDGFLGKAADSKYMLVDLTIRNEDRTESTMPEIVLVDGQGREFRQSSDQFYLHSSFGIIKDVNPGVESRGTLLFYVPPGQYNIRLSGGFQSSDTAQVELKEAVAQENAAPATAPYEGVHPTIAPVGQVDSQANENASPVNDPTDDSVGQDAPAPTNETPQSTSVQPN